jgi:hypothetical protein
MATIIDNVNQRLSKLGYINGSRDARTWLRTKVNSLKATPSTLMSDRDRLRSQSIIGRMYFYYYDPKTKDQLKYYDKFPLVIPIERYGDGFLGLNLHYVEPKVRFILLDKLSTYTNNKMYDETTRLRLSYQTLKSASSIFEATPCIKRYLYSHVKSRFLEINANEWDIAAILPVESFEKKSKEHVFNESRKKF